MDIDLVNPRTDLIDLRCNSPQLIDLEFRSGTPPRFKLLDPHFCLQEAIVKGTPSCSYHISVLPLLGVDF